MCSLPSAAIVSARWSSLNRNKIFGFAALAAPASPHSAASVDTASKHLQIDSILSPSASGTESLGSIGDCLQIEEDINSTLNCSSVASKSHCGKYRVTAVS
jgi:hypothetical protein